MIDATKMNLQSILELKNSQLGFALGIATSERRSCFTQDIFWILWVVGFGTFISHRFSSSSFTNTISSLQTQSPNIQVSASASGGRLGSSSSKESSLSVDMLQTCLKNLGVTNDSGILKLKSFGTIQRCLPWEDRKKVAQVLSRTLRVTRANP